MIQFFVGIMVLVLLTSGVVSAGHGPAIVDFLLTVSGYIVSALWQFISGIYDNAGPGDLVARMGFGFVGLILLLHIMAQPFCARKLFRFFFLLLPVMAGCLVLYLVIIMAAFDLTAQLSTPQPNETDVGDGLIFTLVVVGMLLVLVWLVSRLTLFMQYQNYLSTDVAAEFPAPFPYQEQTILRLGQEIEDTARKGGTIALEGRWGAGKSSILEQFMSQFEEKYNIIHIDIWQEEYPENLHASIFREILFHPAFFHHFFLRVPVRIVFRNLFDNLVGMGKRISLSIPGGGEFELENANSLVELDHQQEIEALIALSKKPVIFMLDEIDRSSPEMARATVTMLQRSLTLPNTAIIMPFVREQLYFKVFNPLTENGPDLGSTIQAVLWNLYFMGDLERARQDKTQIDAHKDLVKELKDTRTYIAVGNMGQGEELSPVSDTGRADRHESSMLDYLLHQYRREAPWRRNFLHQRFSERYLQTACVRVAALRAEDMLAVLVYVADILNLPRIIPEEDPQGPSQVDALMQAAGWTPATHWSLGIRALTGFLKAILGKLDDDGNFPSGTATWKQLAGCLNIAIYQSENDGVKP